MKCITQIFYILFLFSVIVFVFEKPSFSQAPPTDQLAERNRLWSAAKEARENGDLKQAADFGEKLLLAEEASFGKQYKELIRTNNWLADLYEKQNEWGKAELKRDAALVCCTAVYGSEDWRTFDARLALANTRKLSSLTPVQHVALNRASRLISEANRSFHAGKILAGNKSHTICRQYQKGGPW